MGGSLLILGAPGSGKTTLLLELARDLLTRAEQDKEQPIPVVFPLSTWAEQRLPLSEWLVDELSKRYDVPRKIGQAWVETAQVLPLLDGLDEVKAEYRSACIEMVDSFRQDHGLLPLVVCSREKDYKDIGTQLRLQGAIVVQPLTREQAEFYLQRGGDDLASVRQTLRDDPAFWELLDTPLMLNIVTLAYAGQPVTELQTYGSLDERRRHIFSVYVSQMFKRRSSVTRYNSEQTTHWLTWLAKQMEQHSQTVFYLEWIQRDWLPTNTQQKLVHTGTGLVGGLGLALVSWLYVSLTFGLVFGLGLGLYSTLFSYKPAEIMRWSWTELRVRPYITLLFGLVSGLLFGLVGGLLFGLVGGLAGASVHFLMEALSTEDTVNRGVPNEGVYRSVGNALRVFLIWWLVFGLLGGLALGLLGGLGLGAILGLLGGLEKGGFSCIEHLLLRLVLVWNDFAPWRYADFLDYASERILLRKVGGGYMFIHGYLLEYFASLGDESEIEPEPDVTS